MLKLEPERGDAGELMAEALRAGSSAEGVEFAWAGALALSPAGGSRLSGPQSCTGAMVGAGGMPGYPGYGMYPAYGTPLAPRPPCRSFLLLHALTGAAFQGCLQTSVTQWANPLGCKGLSRARRAHAMAALLLRHHGVPLQVCALQPKRSCQDLLPLSTT